ncbi:MAG: hypothetical protein U0223_19715 [Nitrospira sp.]|nr:hypothetical protein [Nitrospira sp.]
MIALTRRGTLGLMAGALGMLALGWMVSPAVASTEGVNEKAKASLQKAHDQLKLAIDQAEKALGSSRRSSGSIRVHMQRVLNILGGKDSPEYADSSEYAEKLQPHFNEKVGNPGDGHGALLYMEDAYEALKTGNAPAAVQEAVEYAIMHASMVEGHAHESVHGTGIKQTQEHAAHTAALLVGAYGKGDSDSPATGALSYAMKQAGLKVSK